MKKILIAIAIVATCCSCGSARNAVPANEEDRAIDVGYGVVDKDKNTYSVSKVKPGKKEVVTYSNIFDYIRGKVPGVMVMGEDRIVIRGIGTNSGNTDPLFILDGVPVPISTVSSIDPNIVDNIEVLKDGSASIYGVQGANGVVIINTKR